jgi:Ca2+-binding RTX toxin-like protein
MPLPIEGTGGPEVIDGLDGVTNGNDIIWAYGGGDLIFGRGGDDQIKGGGGADIINGEAGIDTATYIDSSVGVTVSLLTGTGSGGTAQGDMLSNIENLYGSNHNDTLVGDFGDNALFGVNGNDTLRGGVGADNLDGGAGTDTVSYVDSLDAVLVSLILNLGAGGHAEGDTFVNVENVTGSLDDDVLGGTDGANTLLGMNGNDALKGFGGDDFLFGGTGDDVLLGDAGHDTLDGGTGVDSMEGGTGNDAYYVDHFDDEVSESGGEGIDTVRASVNYALADGADVETLATTNMNGTDDLFLSGNSSGNQIIGNNGDNILNGGGGTDELVGRGGNDRYGVDSADDTVVENGGQGIDEVWASTSYTLTAGSDIELLRTNTDLGVGAYTLVGNSSGNTVRGNNGNNVIDGGEGNDELTALGGHDWFRFSTPLDAATNLDVVTDFNVADDTIELSSAIFSNLAGVGFLSAGEFLIGDAAQDASDRIIYDDETGALYYDADGTGATAAVQFAELDPGLALTRFDFEIVV